MSESVSGNAALSVGELRAASIRQFDRLIESGLFGYRLSRGADGDIFKSSEKPGFREPEKPAYRIFLSGDRQGQAVRLSDGECLPDPIALFREINPAGAYHDESLCAALAMRLRPENEEQIKGFALRYLPELCAMLLPDGWREIDRSVNCEGVHNWHSASRDGRFSVRVHIKNSFSAGHWDDSVSGRSGSDFLSLIQMVRSYTAEDALAFLADQFTISGGLRSDHFGVDLLSLALGVLRSEIESWGAIDFLPFESLPRYKLHNRERPVKGWRKVDPEHGGHHFFYFTPSAFNGLWVEHKNKSVDFAEVLRFLGVLRCDDADGTWREPLPIGCPVNYCVIGRNLWDDLHESAA